jgi:hypothetical protein
MPYVPNDVTFEIDDTSGEITLTLGEWFRGNLESATNGICSSKTQNSLLNIKAPDTDLCTFDPYMTRILADVELMDRAVAAIPEPVQNLINVNVRADLIAMGVDPDLVITGKN